MEKALRRLLFEYKIDDKGQHDAAACVKICGDGAFEIGVELAVHLKEFLALLGVLHLHVLGDEGVEGGAAVFDALGRRFVGVAVIPFDFLKLLFCEGQRLVIFDFDAVKAVGKTTVTVGHSSGIWLDARSASRAAENSFLESCANSSKLINLL